MNYSFALESPPLERQGTFTKDETHSSSEKKPTKIPTPSTTRIPTFTSKVTMRSAPKSSTISESSVASKPPTPRSSYIKSASVDKTNRNSRMYNRSTSADSRDTTASKLQLSHSSHSLKSDSKVQYGAVKKAVVPTLAQRYAILYLLKNIYFLLYEVIHLKYLHNITLLLLHAKITMKIIILRLLL